ncbi:MAG: hypothetical protein MK096_13390 [Oleiphilaceae bacterium]|nr:hypothetical protein [Oleiphilaceae bacterium]
MSKVEMDITTIEEILIGFTVFLGAFAMIKIIEGWYFSHQVCKHLSSNASKANLILPGSFIPNSKLSTDGVSLKLRSIKAFKVSVLLILSVFLVTALGIELLKVLDAKAI